MEDTGLNMRSVASHASAVLCTEPLSPPQATV